MLGQVKELYPELKVTLIENSCCAQKFLENNIQDVAIFNDLSELKSIEDNGKFDIITLLQWCSRLLGLSTENRFIATK